MRARLGLRRFGSKLGGAALGQGSFRTFNRLRGARARRRFARPMLFHLAVAAPRLADRLQRPVVLSASSIRTRGYAHDVRLDDEVGRASDYQKMLVVVAADQ